MTTERQPGNAGATAQNILEQGTEAYVQAERPVSDVYDKTASKLNETYKKIKSYSTENPGKTILVTLGIGMGLGLLLGANSSYYRSRTSRYTRPVVTCFPTWLIKDAGVVDANDKDAFIVAAKTRQWERENVVRKLP